MIIMGIDASPSTTGVAIYDTKVKDFVLITKIQTKIKKATPTNSKRRDLICNELSYLMWTYSVDVVVLENVHIQQLSAALPLAILRGAIEQMIFANGYKEYYTYEASVIKKIVTGKGNAKKEDMYNFIKLQYRKSKTVQAALGSQLVSKDNAEKNEDMADACGIIHAYLTDPDAAQVA